MTILANLPAITPGWVLIGLFVLLGIGFGIILERSRFCFTTAFQETMEFRNPWILQAVFLW
ncbi:MAG: YeeE/YedE family protein, partial [Sulfobacillus sp.]|nr:YeeE/YedE family protein [Sulfobacillus sp.]